MPAATRWGVGVVGNPYAPGVCGSSGVSYGVDPPVAVPYDESDPERDSDWSAGASCDRTPSSCARAASIRARITSKWLRIAPSSTMRASAAALGRPGSERWASGSGQCALRAGTGDPTPSLYTLPPLCALRPLRPLCPLLLSARASCALRALALLSALEADDPNAALGRGAGVGPGVVLVSLRSLCGVDPGCDPSVDDGRVGMPVGLDAGGYATDAGRMRVGGGVLRPCACAGADAPFSCSSIRRA